MQAAAAWVIVAVIVIQNNSDLFMVRQRFPPVSVATRSFKMGIRDG